MLDINKSLEKFSTLDPEIILSVDNDLIAKKLEKIEDKYDITLSPLLIFVATGDMPMEQKSIVKYLKIEFALEEKKALDVFNELSEKVLNPLKSRLDFLNVNPDKSFTVKEEQDYLLNMFSKRLIEEFNDHPIIASAVNYKIFNILSEDIGFKKSLENVLYKNLEQLTRKEFILDEKKAFPGIANWIRDFLKVNGSEFFDNVVLSRYMTTSSNVSKLDPEEKILVKKLLLLYRNLKFFPDSMPSDDGTGWEMLPIGAVETKDKIEKIKELSGPPKTEGEKEIEGLMREEEGYPENSLEWKVLEEEISKKKEIENLQSEANKYPVGSLERKALEAEIKKLLK